jgi:hypothetical protein
MREGAGQGIASRPEKMQPDDIMLTPTRPGIVA